MDFKKCILCFFVLFGHVFGQLDSYLKPCSTTDLVCLQDSAKMFLEHSAPGIPEYGVKAIDPLVVPLVEIELDDHTIKYSFENLNVIGMKDLTVRSFKMDTANNIARLDTYLKVNFSSDVTVQYQPSTEPSPKVYSGSYTGSGEATMIATYSYFIKTNDNGVEYFDVGPETLECTGIEAHGIISEDLMNQLGADADKDVFKGTAGESDETGLCKMLLQIYPIVIENLRTIAKMLPKTAFFTDL